MLIPLLASDSKNSETILLLMRQGRVWARDSGTRFVLLTARATLKTTSTQMHRERKYRSIHREEEKGGEDLASSLALGSWEDGVSYIYNMSLT